MGHAISTGDRALEEKKMLRVRCFFLDSPLMLKSIKIFSNNIVGPGKLTGHSSYIMVEEKS